MSLWSRVRQGFVDKSAKLTQGIRGLWSGKALSPQEREDLEEILLATDMGIEMTTHVLDALTQGKELREVLYQALVPSQRVFHPTPRTAILFMGVNGAGKTTTMGKVASFSGLRTRLVAGDTFRAAAKEQLEVWAHRSASSFTEGPEGADPSSVVFRGIQDFYDHAEDLLLIDTAGRLPNKGHLMDEVRKIHRTLEKNLQDNCQYERFLVLDATSGQHLVHQAKLFHEAVPLTGIIMTKLDGSCKGGALFAMTKALSVPIVLCGLGEKMEDLVPFDAAAFVDGLLGMPPQGS